MLVRERDLAPVTRGFIQPIKSRNASRVTRKVFSKQSSLVDLFLVTEAKLKTQQESTDHPFLSEPFDDNSQDSRNHCANRQSRTRNTVYFV